MCSWKILLSQARHWEYQKDYEILSGQCEIFAKELLDQARSSEELSTILYYSDESDAISQDGILGKLSNHDWTVHDCQGYSVLILNSSNPQTRRSLQSKRIRRSA